MRILVTGAGGMLGRDLVTVLAAGGAEVTPAKRGELDITDAAAVTAAVPGHDVVVNAAAWTDVDGAEEHEAEATRVNGLGPQLLAAVCAAEDARLVHVSSDYVFDGQGTEPYREDDAVRPLSAYGRSKLAGERSVQAASADHAIVRSSWLFGAGGRNFVDTMLRLGAERDELRVVADQVGCPTFTGHLAEALVTIAGNRTAGVLHVAGGGACTWFELARAALEDARVNTRIEPCTTAEFPRPAPRPAYSVLGSTRPDAPTLPPWRDGLRAYLRERAAASITEVVS
jgi:dTDP-4-dehydrorhamnose reductase